MEKSFKEQCFLSPYLIQRGKFRERNEKYGIDKLLQFDYMGSAEFEFGALPDSLDRIRKNKAEYSVKDYQIGKKVITLVCNNNVLHLIYEYLDILAFAANIRTKEYTDFDNYINKGVSNTDFWWDIKSDVMFWKKNVNFEKTFMKLLYEKT